MRDSGVECLGKVPAHWKVRRLGQIGRLSKGNSGNKDDEVPVGVPCVRYGDLYTTHTCFIHDTRSRISAERTGDYTPIRFGDVLFAASGETIEDIGKSAVNLIRSEAYCGGDIVVFRPIRHVAARFMGYATDCRPTAIQKARMGRGITVNHIYGNQLKRLALPLPPLPEQSAIARFLDHADRRIQRCIRAKERLIALLEEQEQATIDQVLTGQVNPRTDKSHATYRQVQVTWLRTVPEHWRLVRLKEVAKVQTGLTLGKDYRNSATVIRPYLRVANVQHGYLDLAKVKQIDAPLSEVRRSTLSNGDVLMTEGGDVDKLGRGCLWKNEIPGCLHQNHVFAVRCDQELLVPEFLVGLMRSSHGRSYFQLTAKQTTNLASTNSTTLRAFPILLPPVDEQLEVLDKVSEEARTIRTVMSRAVREIELVREYRTRLIADVVTGKLDVRKAAAALPAVDPLAADDPDAHAKATPCPAPGQRR